MNRRDEATSGIRAAALSGIRADIQALRALAVTLVVVFHLAPAVLPGGYIGVDVFFVISGFLITAHLMREADSTGRIRLARFWARRARRLLPAALLVLSVCLLITLFVLPVTARPQNVYEIGFAGVYVLNWRLSIMAVDYLGQDNLPGIAQHYWSLSVEEQFYLLWPLLLLLAMLVAARIGKHRRLLMLCTVAAVAVASFTASIVMTAESQPSAYFATTTRAWEFALGALVAFLPALTLPARVRWPLVAVALGAVVACGILFGADTAFPGWIAMIPVAATALAIWFGAAPAGSEPGRWFRPIRFLGDTSYSIYLWHWPLIVTFTAVSGAAPSVPSMVLIAVATVVLAGLTKRFVEDPPRRGHGVFRRPRTVLWLTAGAMATILAASLTPLFVYQAQASAYEAAVAPASLDADGCFGAYALLNGCDSPYERTDSVDPLGTLVGYQQRTRDERYCTTTPVATMGEVTCTVPGSGPGIALVGDSHAEHLIEPMMLAAQSEGWSLEVRTRGMCSALEEEAKLVPSARSSRCIAWGDAVVAEFAADPDITTVVFSLRAASKRDHGAHAAEVMASLVAAGKRVVLIRDVPGTEHSTPMRGTPLTGPECVATTTGDDPCAYVPAAWKDWSVTAAEQSGVPVVDTHDLLCEGGTCHVIIGGTIVYADSNHLAVPFARTLAPWLAAQLRPYVGG